MPEMSEALEGFQLTTYIAVDHMPFLRTCLSHLQWESAPPARPQDVWPVVGLTHT